MKSLAELHDSSIQTKTEIKASPSIGIIGELSSRTRSITNPILASELEKEEESIMKLEKLTNKVDKMGEEIRRLREIVNQLNDDKAKLMPYKEKVKEYIKKYDNIENYKNEIIQKHKNEIILMKKQHQNELEEIKKSFDEMDGLLIIEKRTHNKEAKELKGRICQLEGELKETKFALEEENKITREYINKLDKLKEANIKLKAKVKGINNKNSEVKGELQSRDRKSVV